MDKKMVAVLLGIAGVILWFMPFANIEFMGFKAYQTGQHIGGIAYLLLLASIAYAALSWMQQSQLAVIAAAVATGVCLLFAVQVGASIAWGLILLLIVSIASIVFAVRNRQNQGLSGQAAGEEV